MVDLTMWRDRSRVLLQIGLLATCAAAVLATRSLVGADDLTDFDDLALSGGTIILLMVATIIAMAGVKHSASFSARWLLRLGPIGLALLSVMFVRASYADVSVELESIVRAHAPETRASIVIGPGGRDIRLAGDMNMGDAARLERLLDANPGVERIHLTSEGGIADEGQAIGDVIAAHGLVTFVPDYCASACTLAFIRGRERLLMQRARLGFHAPYEEGLFGHEFRGDSSAQRHAYLDAGLDPGFVDEALRVDPSDLWIPEASRLIAARAVTAVVDHYRFPDSNLDGTADFGSARALVLRTIPVLSGFEAIAPAVVDRIVTWYLDGYRNGQSEGAAVDGLRVASNAALAPRLARADDRTLAILASRLAAAMALASTSDDCVAIGLRGDIVLADHLLAGATPDGEDALAPLVGASLAGPIGPAEIARPALRSNVGDTPSCASVRAAFASMSIRPGREIAAMMRQILSGNANSPILSIMPASLMGP